RRTRDRLRRNTRRGVDAARRRLCQAKESRRSRGRLRSRAGARARRHHDSRRCRRSAHSTHELPEGRGLSATRHDARPERATRLGAPCARRGWAHHRAPEELVMQRQAADRKAHLAKLREEAKAYRPQITIRPADAGRYVAIAASFLKAEDFAAAEAA